MTSSSDNNCDYVRGVSFNTMTDPSLPDYSFTLNAKTPEYKRTRRSRMFMEMMDDGDEIVVLRVLTVDLNDKKKGVHKTLKEECSDARQSATDISVTIEFVIGKVQSSIHRAISMYQPSLLVVGTRGMSELKGIFSGSVSKYCLQHSPVPVTVVRSDPKDSKNKSTRKRLGSLIGLPVSSDSDDDQLGDDDQQKKRPASRRKSIIEGFGGLLSRTRSRSSSRSQSRSRSSSRSRSQSPSKIVENHLAPPS
ncbi:hypothetical protein PHYBLDRAFT_138477 [Phycomyces blakesleeanus NRRL 1555(-)]|uniref:UspA domain-containing protein n=1 Tax=Phycomyces blakesleeanus (strain ATCC 8743b / DSM 1359 / FGSC 10004 / NBRC 33097 / NRRL 1555) TaxID=763407 RepID=A0A167R5X1_PHYB8|nr:hypothetical protein PHYBLDRAFT_138477 [Phycomyces blakesleeanus NRRL 1555(-)]OAD80924.1 hypothetical protein PHYBLDRAFT_138477 [Phycomyces blakesleeanus NRRL 1555(-)]|eukprot:XP_018298964.1 hypothetical protein PHYBLDRAFT_138477 [Phycomyces blakesleeanus NRRL 1555(-)]